MVGEGNKILVIGSVGEENKRNKTSVGEEEKTLVIGSVGEGNKILVIRSIGEENKGNKTSVREGTKH